MNATALTPDNKSGPGSRPWQQGPELETLQKQNIKIKLILTESKVAHTSMGQSFDLKTKIAKQKRGNVAKAKHGNVSNKLKQVHHWVVTSEGIRTITYIASPQHYDKIQKSTPVIKNIGIQGETVST